MNSSKVSKRFLILIILKTIPMLTNNSVVSFSIIKIKIRKCQRRIKRSKILILKRSKDMSEIADISF